MRGVWCVNHSEDIKWSSSVLQYLWQSDSSFLKYHIISCRNFQFFRSTESGSGEINFSCLHFDFRRLFFIHVPPDILINPLESTLLAPRAGQLHQQFCIPSNTSPCFCSSNTLFFIFSLKSAKIMNKSLVFKNLGWVLLDHTRSVSTAICDHELEALVCMKV